MKWWIDLDLQRYPTVKQQSTITAAIQGTNVMKESDNETETQESVERRVHGLLRSLFRPVSCQHYSLLHQYLSIWEQHSEFIPESHFCTIRQKLIIIVSRHMLYVVSATHKALQQGYSQLFQLYLLFIPFVYKYTPWMFAGEGSYWAGCAAHNIR